MAAAAAAEKQGMTAYEAAPERNVQENKRKMEALNLRHLSAVIKEAPKPQKPNWPRIIEEAVVVPAPRRSRRLAQLHPEIAPHSADRMTRSQGMKASLEATKRAEELLQSQLDHDIPSFVKAIFHSHVVGDGRLPLPGHFCDTYMPKQGTTITLLDEKDKEFDTKYVAYNKVLLRAGWADFAKCHGIRAGDAAVFQLIKPTTFKVYIVRAASDDGIELDE